jgi:hypothetical protein
MMRTRHHAFPVSDVLEATVELRNASSRLVEEVAQLYLGRETFLAR